jgi:ABC-type bacteriocin/lantibiotic exporter with double-glycine peptidase domain
MPTPVHYDWPLSYIAQSQPMSCWAASAAMLTSRTEAEILQEFSDFGSDGASEPECQALAQRLSLNIMPEACRATDGWAQLLSGGAVMVGIPGHFIVVSGIYVDDAGNAQLHVLDPAAGDHWSTLETVENGYEADWEFSYDLLQK